jgi:hypothetical protein
MKKLNENITRLKTLMNISEADDVYANVDFKDRVVGSSTPSKDNINVALLKDVQTAAERAGVKVDITTAISGHRTGKSRHTTGNAVDIAIINGKAVSNSNRADADKLVGELIKMGYTKNRESGNPKAVLTFGFPGHDNHVHVSNTTGTPTEKQDSQVSEPLSPSSEFAASQSSTDGEKQEPESDSRSFSSILLKTIMPSLNLKEEKVYGSFGNNTKNIIDGLLIPNSSNSKIKSPVEGVIENYSNTSSCKNQVTVKHSIEKNIFYLQYCGIENVKVSRNDSVKKGDVLGTVKDDVKVTLFSDSGKKLYISDYINKDINKSNKNKKDGGNDNDDKSYKKEKTYHDPLMAGIFSLPGKLFSDLMNSGKNKKVNENIERIKKLLK